MPLDPNIIMGSKPVEIQNPLDVALKAQSLKSLAYKNQVADKEMADEQNYNSILKQNTSVGADGKIAVNRPQAIQALSQSGQTQKALSLQEKWATEDLAQVNQRTTLSKQLAWSMTPENYSQVRSQAIKMGIPHAENLPEQYDPTVVRQLQMSTLNAEEQLKQMNSDRDFGIKKDEMGLRKEEVGIKRQEAGVKAKAATAQSTTELRKERSNLPTTKATQEISAAYNKIQEAAKDPSAAGDMSLIFGFMKILDPGSTVREGEFASAQNAGGIDSKVVSAYNSILNGQRLSPEQRRDFMSQAGNLYKAQSDIQGQVDAQFSSLAGKSGVNPEDVILNFGANGATKGGAIKPAWAK